MTNDFTPRATRITHSLAATGLALCMTLAALGSLDHLATTEHAATVLAKAAATAQQAKAETAAAAPRG
jgi:hypothetical protein